MHTESHLSSILSVLDPLVNSILKVFVDKIGPEEGMKAFKIFLASLPIFSGILICALFAMMPNNINNNNNSSEEDRDGSDDDRLPGYVQKG